MPIPFSATNFFQTALLLPMLSIIIASASRQLAREIKENIAQTVGCPHEVLLFDNSDGKRSMCGIYNEGAWQATFELLCFMHEDVALKTEDWGNAVAQLFKQNNRLGVLGIAGSTYKSLTPSGWLSHNHLRETEYSQLIQSYKYSGTHTLRHYRNPGNRNPANVATVDGVWMCVKKDVALRFPFDEQTFQKFHCYDLDFCLSVGLHYDIVVTFDVLLHHFSDGNFNAEWMEEALKLHKKWRSILPVCAEPFTPKEVRTIEKQNFIHYLGQFAKLGLPAGAAHRLIWQHGYGRRFGLVSALRFHKYVIEVYRQNQKD